MEASILTSTKKILGIDAGQTAFDPDVTTHINSALVTVNQLGLGPNPMIFVDTVDETWDMLALTPNQLNLCRTYVFLKVRMLFDPPSTSFLIEAINRQIEEHEHRMSMERENAIVLPPPPVEDTDEFYYYDEVIETL